MHGGPARGGRPVKVRRTESQHLGPSSPGQRDTSHRLRPPNDAGDQDYRLRISGGSQSQQDLMASA